MSLGFFGEVGVIEDATLRLKHDVGCLSHPRSLRDISLDGLKPSYSSRDYG